MASVRCATDTVCLCVGRLGHSCSRSRLQPALLLADASNSLSLSALHAPCTHTQFERPNPKPGSRLPPWPAAARRSAPAARRQVTRMMPIGVPRVPCRTPKEGTWQWVDIWNCLYRERIIFLSKPVDDELGNQARHAGVQAARCSLV